MEDRVSTQQPARRRMLPRVAPFAAVALVAAGVGGTAGALARGDASPTSTTPAVTTAQPVATTQSSIGAVYKKVSAGVVEITVTGSSGGNGFGPFGQQQTQSEGSGFVLDKEGHIVTNEHVVDGADSITVHFASGKTAKATVVGTDASTDIAVLKVNVAASELTPLTLGSSSSVQVGANVIAIGSPFGLENTVTAGIVSAVGRQIEAPNSYTITGAIQTDAAINPGNSGGPLLDASGRVIGVNAQIQSSTNGNEGVGFAIPIDSVKKVVSQLIGGRTVTHAYLGVQVTDTANGTGAQIGSVQSGSPADKAGLQAGDVVTAVDGKNVASASDLTAAITTGAPGNQVRMTVDRNGSTRTITATLGTRPS
jgi:putative serine protease PepD